MKNKFLDKYDLNTPCFIIDEKEFRHNIECFHKKLVAKFSNYIIGYSFKTNSLPRIIKLAKDLKCYAEVVSEDEFELAKKIGFPHKRIIYNGPIKTKNSFIEAVEKGSIVNIDSQREIEWLDEIRTSTRPSVGIRVNFDLESRVPGQTSTGNSGGRFGFCYENGELKRAISSIQKKTEIKCLHMHVSNASKSVNVYRELALMVCRIVKEEKLELQYIDFGGGYFGGGDDGEAYEKYVEVIQEVLQTNNLDNICVIVEPGASVVATAVSYLTKVVDVKNTTYGRFVFTDGTRLDIDPFMRKKTYVYEILGTKAAVFGQQIICGYTCMENDRIMLLNNEIELLPGDRVEYKIVGSYTMGFSNLFINYLPNVYSNVGGNYILVRERWGVDEFIRKNRWEL